MDSGDGGSGVFFSLFFFSFLFFLVPPYPLVSALPFSLTALALSTGLE